MARPHAFGVLRMYAAIMKRNREEFKDFLKSEGYSDEELINIKKAFESLNTKTPVVNEKVF